MHHGELKPTKKVAEKIFECTLCGKCSSECPAGVDTTKIFLKAREGLLKSYLNPTKRGAFSIIENPTALSLLGKGTSIIPGFSLKKHSKTTKFDAAQIDNSKMKVALFGGCLVNHFLQDIKDSTIKVLGKNNIETVSPEEKCCGIPLYFSGAVERAARLARHNIKALESLKADAIITACPTCKIGLKSYPKILEGEERERAKMVADKTHEISEFLNKFGDSKQIGVIEKNVTYHESCHMNYGLGLSNISREIITSIPGLDLIEMKDSASCCGFGGLFTIDNPDLSKKMKQRKIFDIQSTKAEEVISPCPGCIMYLQRALLKEGSNIKVRHPIQLLREAYLTVEAKQAKIN
jgi:glycolate oxidase iron-sulfur subunit